MKDALREHRLVTIIGPGGVGKTRLALEVAYQMSRVYSGGCWLIDLGKHPARQAIVDHVASALELTRESGQWTAPDLAARLSARRSLLIFDTCEHVVDEVADLVQGLLRSTTSVDVLTTSRQALGAGGEQLVPLEGLEFPSSADHTAPSALAVYESVSLFIERGRSILPGLDLTAENAEAVADIARRLEGYPLAIELAAARLRVLAPTQIASRLKNQFRLLGATRVAETRHQTLRATIEWSYELCSRAERLCWARLSVFPADFDLDAAEAVAHGGDIGEDDVLALAGALVDKSILRTTSDSGEKARYRFTDPVRDFGAEKLDELEPNGSARSRHLEYFSRMAEAVPELLFGPYQVERTESLRLERANLEAGLVEAVAENEMDTADSLACAIALVSFASGALAEAFEAVEIVAKREGDRSAARVRLLWLSAWIAINQGNLDLARQRATECRRLAQMIDDRRGMIHALQYLGQTQLLSGDTSTAERECRRAVSLARTAGEEHLVATSLVRYAQVLDALGKQDQARSALEEAIGISERVGERWCRGFALWNLALLDQDAGDPGAAMRHAQEMLASKSLFEDVVGIAQALEVMAWCSSDLDRPDQAAVLLGAASVIWESTGAVLPDPLLVRRHACEQRLAAALGEGEVLALRRSGRSMRPEQAMSWSGRNRERDEQSPPADVTPGGAQTAPLRAVSPLTVREHEVAQLVATGLKNREIADRLVISPRTAEAHVEHILSKLGFNSRAQIRTWVSYQADADL